MALGNTTLNQEQMEKIYMSTMTKPEQGTSYKYKEKSYNTFKEALRAEFYDKFEEVIKNHGGGSYLSYSKDAIMNGVEEIRDLCDDFHKFVEEDEHPTIRSCVVEASDFGW